MKKIKFALLCEYSMHKVAGGIEKSIASILNQIDLDKFEVTLILKHPSVHDYYLQEFQSGVRIRYLLNYCVGYYTDKSSDPSGWKLREPRFLFHQIANNIIKCKLKKVVNEYDIILDVDARFLSINRLRQKFSGKAQVLGWWHGDYPLIRQSLVEVQKSKKVNFIDGIDGLIFVNNYSKNEMYQYLTSINHPLRNHLYTLYNGLNLDTIKKLSEALPDSNDKQILGSKYILMIGRMVATKDHKTLIKAFAKIKLIYPDYKLVLLGDGKLRGDLEYMVKQLGLSTEIYFLGFRDNPYIWIKQCQVFVLSTHQEGLSIVINEAMLFNKPIIVSAIPPCLEAIGNGSCGMSFPVGDDTVLSELLVSAIDGGEAINHMLIEQKTFIRQFYIKNTIQYLEKIISNILVV